MNIHSKINHIIYDKPLENLSDSDIASLNSSSLEEVIPILLAIFYKENDNIMKSKIYDAILSIKGFDAVEFLIDIFDTHSPDWQIVICGSFSQYRDSRAITKLSSILSKHPDPDIRYTAAESLGEIGDSTAIQALEHAQANDTYADFEGFPIADVARASLVKIRARIK